MKTVVAPFIGIVFWSSSFFGISQTIQNTKTSMHPYNRIEVAAAAVKPHDTESIKELSDAVIASPHCFRLPDEITSIVSSKLQRAESQYRNHSQPGISEEQVVSVMNLLGKSFNFPKYAETTHAQVRTLHMKLAIAAPVLYGEGLTPGRDMKKGETLRGSMSPLQATHLLATLIDQKMVNDDYADASNDLKERDMARSKRVQEQTSRQPKGRYALVSEPASQKSAEIRRSMKRAVSSMSVSDAIILVNSALDIVAFDK